MNLNKRLNHDLALLVLCMDTSCVRIESGVKNNRDGKHTSCSQSSLQREHGDRLWEREVLSRSPKLCRGDSQAVTVRERMWTQQGTAVTTANARQTDRSPSNQHKGSSTDTGGASGYGEQRVLPNELTVMMK